MANAWVEFVKKWSKDNNQTYSCAVSLPECRQAYQATKPPKKAKKLTQKQEREAMGAEDVASQAQRAEATASLQKKKAVIKKGKTILKAKLAKKDTEKELLDKFPAYAENKSMKQELASMGAEDVNRADITPARPRGRPKKYATAEEAKKAKAEKTVEAKKKRQATKKAEKEAKKAKPTENIQMTVVEPPPKKKRGGMGCRQSRQVAPPPPPVARLQNRLDRILPAPTPATATEDTTPLASAYVLQQAPTERQQERERQRVQNILLLKEVLLNLNNELRRLIDRINGSRSGQPTRAQRLKGEQLISDIRDISQQIQDFESRVEPDENVSSHERSSCDSLPSELSFGSVAPTRPPSPTGSGRRGGKSPCYNGYEMIGTKKKKGKTVPNCVPLQGGVTYGFNGKLYSEPSKGETVRNGTIYKNGMPITENYNVLGNQIPVGGAFLTDDEVRKQYFNQPVGSYKSPAEIAFENAHPSMVSPTPTQYYFGGAIVPSVPNEWFHNYAQNISKPLIDYQGLASSIAHPNITQVRDLVSKINGLIG